MTYSHKLFRAGKDKCQFTMSWKFAYPKVAYQLLLLNTPCLNERYDFVIVMKTYLNN